MRGLPYDDGDKRRRRSHALAKRRPGASDPAFREFVLGDPRYLEDDPGMGAILGEDVSDGDLRMRRRNGRALHDDEVGRLERRALAGDREAIRRLAAMARGLPQRPVVKYAVRVIPWGKGRIKQRLKELDPDLSFDPEENPITFWVNTSLSKDEIMSVDGVDDII